MKTKSITKLLCGITAAMFISHLASAQFQLSGQYMSRGEYRHGYQTLADTNQKASVFISQRARINAEYKHDKFKFFVSAQDIRTWGSVANSAIDNKGLFSLFEGYGELLLTKKIGFKVGRQVLSYDDDRIFGGLDWAMQGRRHDAGVFKYTDSTWTVHAGGAYNQNAESNVLRQYTVASNYKTFQFLWANKVYKKLNMSFLFLNNGNAYSRLNGTTGKKDSMTLYTQTTGLRLEYKSAKIVGTVYGYYQMGDDATNKATSAFNAAAEVGYKPVKSLLLTLGGEILSGTSQTDTTKKYRDVNHSFTPFYGTNHRFNGYMDYFYAGSAHGNVGLIDAFFKVNYTYKNFLAGVNTHMFSSAADILDKSVTTGIAKMNPNLGTEVDVTLSYNVSDGASIQGGYSQMFGTSSLKAIKGGQISTTSNWAYLMIILRPGGIKWPKVGLKL